LFLEWTRRMWKNPSKMPRLTKRAIAIKEYEALAERRVKKAFIRLCFDDEDSLEDDIDQLVLAELALLKSSRYCLRGVYRQWNSSWEGKDVGGWYVHVLWWVSVQLSNGSSMRHAVEQSGWRWWSLPEVGKRASMLHVMVLLKNLGSYVNAAAMQKIGHMMGISKGSVNDYVMWTCAAILKHRSQV